MSGPTWRVAGLVLAAVLSACGPTPASSGVSTTAEPDLFHDAVVQVTGDAATDVCSSASVESLDVRFPELCLPPPHRFVLEEAGAAPYGPSARPLGTVSLFVSAYPLEITRVRQDDQEVPWRQDGGGVLVAGGPTMNFDTVVDFVVDGTEGSCHFGPNGFGCSYEP